jgi:ketosteroid isomerase-like protein
LAALYTEDAILVNDTGPIYGRKAIEKHCADLFKQVHFSNLAGMSAQNIPLTSMQRQLVALKYGGTGNGV